MNLPPDFWLSIVIIPFLINLLTTVIGIAVTVFWIDRLIQDNEKKRWIPSKNFLYSKLLNISGRVLPLVLPTFSYGHSQAIYYFGDVAAFPRYEFGEKLGKSDLFESQQLELRILTPAQIIQKIDRLVEILTEVNEVLAQSAFLLEPELLMKLLKVRYDLESISSTKDILETEKNSEELANNSVLILTHDLSAIFTSFDALIDWLVKISDRRETYKDIEQRIFNAVSSKSTA